MARKTTRSMVGVQEEKVQIRSPADFFHDNKAIAGFDNSMRVVFTSVRELVENGLDAAEKANKLPQIEVKIERLTKDRIAQLLGVEEIEKAGRLDFLKLTVRDNGIGIPGSDIPILFGTVLAGSNYGARQTRGRFGLGAKMVLLNAMSSVDLPISVKSRHIIQPVTSKYQIYIDLQKNEPNIVYEETLDENHPEAFQESGTEVSVTFTGSWHLAKMYVTDYFHQLSVITPYATFKVEYPDGEKDVFERVVTEMPEPPKLTKIHPWGCDITQFKREVAVTESKDMISFLLERFNGIENNETAKRFLDYVKIDETKNPQQLSQSEIRRIVHEGFQKSQESDKKVPFKFKSPKGDSLSPLGEERLKKGLMKEVEDTEFVAAITRDPATYSGHPFVVEAALAYTGKARPEDKSKNIKLFRFANRIPLIFGQSSDVAFKVINSSSEINWSRYKVTQYVIPNLTIAVSLVSTKIPFPETSKEYIADVVHIRKEIKLAVRELARKLRTHLGRVERKKRSKKRQSRFETIAPKVIKPLMDIIISTDEKAAISPYYNEKKLIKSLAMAEPKILTRLKPPSQPLVRANTWVDSKIVRKLKEGDVKYVCDFLIRSDLAKISTLDDEDILKIKRRTLHEYNKEEGISLDKDFNLFSNKVETAFNSKAVKMLNMRWINTIFDFYAADWEDLSNLDYFAEMIVSQMQRKVLWLLTREKTLNNLSKPDNFILVENELDVLYKELQKEFKSLEKSLETKYMEKKTEWNLDSLWFISLLYIVILRKNELVKLDKMVIKSIKAAKREIKEIYTKETLEKRIFLSLEQLNASIRDILRKNGFKTWKDFHAATNKEILSDEDIKKVLTENRLKKVRQEINEKIRSDCTDKIELNPLEWISAAVRDTLKDQEIESWNDFLQTPNQELLKITELKDALADDLRKKIIFNLNNIIDEASKEEISVDLSDEFNLIEGFSKQKTMKALLEFLTLQDISKKEKNISKLFIKLRKDKWEQYRTHSSNVRGIEELVWLPSEIEKLLHKEDIKSIFDALTTNKRKFTKILSDQLKNFKFLNKSVVDDLKEQYGTKMDFLKESQLNQLNSLNIYILEELLYNNLSAVPKDQKEFVQELQEKLKVKICYLSEFTPKVIKKLEQSGINEVGKFLVWPEHEIVKFGLKKRIIDEIKENFSLKTVLEQKERHSLPLEQIKPAFDNKLYDKLVEHGIESIQQFYFTTIEDFLYELNIPSKDYDEFSTLVTKARSELEKPVVLLPDFPVNIAFELNNIGINKTIEFLYIESSFLAAKTSLSEDEIQTMKDTFDGKFNEGNSLRDYKLFSSSIITSFSKDNINTIEQIYFSLEKESFVTEKIKWAEIEKTRRLLEMPLSMVILVEKSEQSDETGDNESIIPKSKVNQLERAGIENVIKFLITDAKTISKESGLKTNEIKLLKSQLKLKEQDISLFDIGTFSRKQERRLEQLGITTVQDLYFLSIEDLDEAEIDDFSFKDFVWNLKLTLNVPLSALHFFNEEQVERLRENRINSVMRFLLISPEEVANKAKTTEKYIKDIRIELNLIKVVNELNKPIILLESIPPQNYNNLLEKNVDSVLKFLSTPSHELIEVMNLSEEEITNIKHDVNLKKIEDRTSQLLPLQSFFDLTKTELKKLEDLKISTVEEIFYTIDQSFIESLDDTDIVILVQKIKDVLDLPVYLIFGDTYTAKDRKKLLEVGLTSIGEFLAWPNSTIAKITNKKLGKVKTSKKIELDEIYKVLKVPVTFSGVFTKEQVKILQKHGIKTLFKLYLTSNTKLSEILEQETQEIEKLKRTINLDKIEDNLNIPIEIVLPFDQDVITNLKRRRVKTLHDYIAIPIAEKEEFLDKTQEELLSVEKDLDIKEIQQAYTRSIIWFPNLEGYHAYKLQKNEIITINDFMEASNDDLKELTEITKKRLKNLKDNLTIPRIKAQFEKRHVVENVIESFKLDEFKLDIKSLKLSHEELFYGDIEFLKEKGLSKEAIEKIQRIYQLKIDYLELPDHVISKLRENSINNLIQYFTTSNDILQNIVGKSFKLPDKDKFDLKTIQEERKDSIELNTITGITTKISDKLKQHRITYIHDFLATKEEKLAKILTKKELLQVEQLKAPIVFIEGLSGPQIIKLERHGCRTVADFLALDVTSKNLNLEEPKKLKKIKQDINLSKIEINRLTNGTRLSALNAFPDSVQERLNDAGYENIEEVYFLITKNNAPSRTWRSIESFRRTINSPVHHLRILRRHPDKLITLIKNNIASLAEFYWTYTPDLVKLLKLDKEEVQEIKNNLDLDRVKRRLRKKIHLNLVTNLDEKTKDILHDLNIYTVEDLYCMAKKIDFESIEGINSEFIKTLIDNLNKRPAFLKSMTYGLASKLKDHSINTVIEFLLFKNRFLAKEIDTKITTIRDVKKSIEFYTQEELKQKIQKTIGKEVET